MVREIRILVTSRVRKDNKVWMSKGYFLGWWRCLYIWVVVTWIYMYAKVYWAVHIRLIHFKHFIIYIIFFDLKLFKRRRKPKESRISEEGSFLKKGSAHQSYIQLSLQQREVPRIWILAHFLSLPSAEVHVPDLHFLKEATWRIWGRILKQGHGINLTMMVWLLFIC